MTDAEFSGRAPGWKRASDVAAAGLLAGLAFVLRALPWPGVFTADGVRLVGPDAHYHLRRIQWSVENFPAALTRDSYLRFPDGGEAIWPPAFDWALAGVARLLVGRGDEGAVEALVVWVPPLLAALTVAGVYATGRCFFGRGAGLLAAATLAVLPAHVSWSAVGFVDHHVAVSCLSIALLGGTFAVLREPARSMLPATALGACMGAALLLWPGCLLHVTLTQLCLVAWVGSGSAPGQATERATHATVAHGVAFLAVAPFAATGVSAWGTLSPVVLSGFQPLWLGLPTLGLGACAIAWRGPEATSMRARAAALTIGLGVPAAVSLLFPEVRAGAGDALTWLLRDEGFQAVVSESLPLLSDGDGGLSVQRAHAQLTPLVWAVPVLIALLAARGRSSPTHAALALWSVALFAATLAQYRFANSFSVVLALSLGACIAPTRRILAELPVGAGRAVAVVTGLIGVVLLAPIVNSQIQALGAARRALAGEIVRMPERVQHHTALVDTASWLRDHSEPTGGWLQEGGQPAYGVLGAWGDGHVVRYVARRPVVQDNFGDDLGRKRFDQAEEYYAAASEAEALRIAADLRARYVLVRHSGSGHAPAPYPAQSMLARLYRLRGAAAKLRDGGAQDDPVYLPALSRHRLLYESPDLRGEEGGRYKLFEIVKGAVVRGHARADQVVEAHLVLHERDGHRRFEYRAHARANAAGEWALRLPYPTEDFESRFVAEGPYRLFSGESARPLNIREGEVRSGATLEGPDLAG